MNAGDADAHVAITIFFADRNPVGPYRVMVAAVAPLRLRFNDLSDPQQISRDTDYASVFESDVPIILQHTRMDSRRAEIALLSEEPEQAMRTAAKAVAAAEAARAPRHVAKGLLFQGVAELQSGSGEAAATLRRASTLAEGLGALPLVWQARGLLGAMLAVEPGDEGARSLAVARSAVLAIAGDLPTALRDEWLARPNVSALLEG